MKKKQTKAQKSNYQKYFPLVIFISILCMSVGYAIINSIILQVDGDVIAKNHEGVYITEIILEKHTDANISNCTIKDITELALNSTIELSATNASSYVTYKITLYNNSANNHKFKQSSYEDDFYDNKNILYELTNINQNTIIEPHSYMDFEITFKYANDADITQNKLNSYIIFEFEFEPTIVATYNYTGTHATFNVPYTGKYKIELWGGSPNNAYNAYVIAHPSYGAYTSGEITLNKNTDLYIYVGGKKALFNANSKIGQTGSGGATDVRLISGTWNSFESLSSRIMVAAGAGGSYSDSSAPGGGHGGGLQSTYVYHKTHPIHSATQTAGGKEGYKGTAGTFGIGGINEIASYNPGGGGYFGGGSAPGAGGGSSFISGHNGCVAITAESTQDNIIQKTDSLGNICTDGTTDITCSYHYSNYIFTNTVMIDGGGYEWTTEKNETSTGMPTFDGEGIMTGNDGQGYAKITLIEIIK